MIYVSTPRQAEHAARGATNLRTLPSPEGGSVRKFSLESLVKVGISRPALDEAARPAAHGLYGVSS